MNEPADEHRIVFDPDVHMCRTHRRILEGSPDRNLFRRVFMLTAVDSDEVTSRQPLGPSGQRSAQGIARTLVDLSPLCCMLGDERMALVAHRAHVAPCQFCVFRAKHDRWRLQDITCAVCSNTRWHPAVG